MELTLCTQGVLSILLVTIVCVTIGINYQDTLIIIILTALIIFAVNLGKLYYGPNNSANINNTNVLVNNNEKVGVLASNSTIDNTSINHSILNPEEINENTNNNKEIENENLKLNIEEKKPYHLQNTDDNIMDARTYNLEDCTTDMSCIQKPDDNNLFTGFENMPTYLSAKANNSILQNSDTQNNKITGENKSLKKDNIVVENFETCPIELNDLVKPFNNAVINPYKNYRLEEEIQTKEDKFMSSKDIGDQLCFNCKVGHCQGGVCHDINELKADEIKNVVKEINNMKKVHPFSKNFPTIRASNPDAHY